MLQTALCAAGLLCCARALAGPPSAPTPTDAEMAEKARWVRAALEGTQRSRRQPPFSFAYGGRPSRDLLPAWSVKRTRGKISDARHGARIQRTLTCTDPETGLEARCVSVEYRDYPTVEWTLYLRNGGTVDTPVLADIRALDVHFDLGADAKATLRRIRGDNCTPQSYEPLVTDLAPAETLHVANTGGRPTQEAFPYVNVGWQGGGVLCVLGWPGQWNMDFVRDAGGELDVRGGQEATHFVLHPGEEVRVPLVVLQFYAGDWLRAQNVWRRWMLAHNVPWRQGRPLETRRCVCNAMNYPGYMGVAATELGIMQRHFGEGIDFDVWWQDAGWYPCDGQGWPAVGTWEVDPVRYPRGVRQIADYVHQRGKSTIMWFEPERVVAGTWLPRHHPEWVHGGPDGGLLDLSNPECRAWLVDHIDRVLTEQGIDDYRQDLNMDPLPYWHAADAPDRQGITEIRHVEGYLAFWDELAKRRPGMLIDSCASGGRRNDLETLRRAVPLLRSDCCTPAEAQQCHTYGLSLWVPYQGTAYGYGVDTYFARSATVASLLTGSTSEGIDHVDWGLIRRTMQEHRRMSPYTLGDFYPLTPYSPAQDCWMAFQFDRPDIGGGMVQAFRRPESTVEAGRYVVHGLDPGADYELTDLDTGAATCASGASLMTEGVAIATPSAPGSAVVEYRRR